MTTSRAAAAPGSRPASGCSRVRSNAGAYTTSAGPARAAGRAARRSPRRRRCPARPSRSPQPEPFELDVGEVEAVHRHVRAAGHAAGRPARRPASTCPRPGGPATPISTRGCTEHRRSSTRATSSSRSTGTSLPTSAGKLVHHGRERRGQCGRDRHERPPTRLQPGRSEERLGQQLVPPAHLPPRGLIVLWPPRDDRAHRGRGLGQTERDALAGERVDVPARVADEQDPPGDPARRPLPQRPGAARPATPALRPAARRSAGKRRSALPNGPRLVG